MNEFQCAQTQPATRAWRFKRFFIVRIELVCRLLQLLFFRLAYRHLMRLSHYFGWHYAPSRQGPDGEYYRRCNWCGMHGTVYDPNKPLRAGDTQADG